ncbi:hypothetical protein GCM10028790_40110 [Micromonospora taraxaci]
MTIVEPPVTEDPVPYPLVVLRRDGDPAKVDTRKESERPAGGPAQDLGAREVWSGDRQVDHEAPSHRHCTGSGMAGSPLSPGIAGTTVH